MGDATEPMGTGVGAEKVDAFVVVLDFLGKIWMSSEKLLKC